MQIHQPVITTNGGIRVTWAEVNLTRLSQNIQAISSQDLADWAGTIPYEILTIINTRVPRVYITEDIT